MISTEASAQARAPLVMEAGPSCENDSSGNGEDELARWARAASNTRKTRSSVEIKLESEEMKWKIPPTLLVVLYGL